jgi:ABC-type branched-subunit amino acid transport system substrate-binding protein
VLNTSEKDLIVFWRWLNDKGGLFGRRFDVTLEDDQYTAEGGVPAAQKCSEKSPFMIFGAIGSDVLPPVRVWAEQNKQLYLYGFTIKKGSENMRYSFTGTISQEELSLVIAKLAVAKFPGKKVGLVWRNSSNFQPGRDVFKSYVSSHGSTVVADLPVQKSQGSYSNEIVELQQKGAEVVFVLDDALAQLNVIKQGKTQNYNPNWLVFTFNAQTKALEDDALNPPIQGANLAPSYVCHTFDGPYAEYAAELHEFEDAYAKYSPDTDLCGIAGDIAWGTWLGFKGMAALFEACGPNCTRNRWAGVMESGYKGKIGAGCPFDFSSDGHHGGHAADLMEAYRAADGTAGFRNFQRCATAGG